jgi:hypothetical protein
MSGEVLNRVLQIPTLLVLLFSLLPRISKLGLVPNSNLLAQRIHTAPKVGDCVSTHNSLITIDNLMGPAPRGTGTITLDPTFGRFTVLEPLSH